MVIEKFIRYAGLAVGLMVFEQCIRYAGLAVGLKPSARGCEARLRGRERSMYSKTISPRLWHAQPAGADERRPCGCVAHRWVNIRLFLGGLRSPKPSRGRGVGKPGFPTPRSKGQCVAE